MNWNKFAKWLRLSVLMGLLAWVTYEAYMHQVLGGGKAPSVHALCPFGALESLYTLLFMGSFIKKIYSGTVVLLGLTVVLAILFRRSFCGLLCPFGALQELFARIGQKVFRKRLAVPKAIDRPLRYLKYVILALTVIMAWYYGTLWMSPYDPYTAYSHITVFSDSIKEDPLAVIGFILLAVTVLGSFVYDRFFCKYLCPMGAFYGIIGKISPTRVQRNDNLCIHCKICNKVCPANIEVEKASNVTSMECLNCNQCVMACPKKGALEVKTAKRAFHPGIIIMMVTVLFFGTILIAQETGNFEVIPSSLKEGEVVSISEIKGYYSIEEAAVATGLSLKEVYEKLGIPEHVSKSTKMKEISKEAPEYSFDEAKEKAGGTETPAKEKEVSQNQTAEASKKVDISGIKGSMTIRDAAESLKMDVKEFYKLFKIPDNVSPQTQMKGISSASPGYDFEKVKEVLR